MSPQPKAEATTTTVDINRKLASKGQSLKVAAVLLADEVAHACYTTTHRVATVGVRKEGGDRDREYKTVL